jgi:undecaprenyl-diphosphatase
VQAALGVLVVGAVLFVAYLALYTGAHTFTDVLGGMALGGAIVAVGSAVLAATSRATGA